MVGNAYAAEHQRTLGIEAVGIVTVADAHNGSGRGPPN
jgi:hypothetical protein